MANEKQIKARFQQKHDIEANWNLAANFIPKAGEIIVYDPDVNYNYSRLKIGDGVTSVNQLNFIIDEKKGEGVLIVTIDETTAQASHTSTEICAHVQNGGTVVLLYYDIYMALGNCSPYNAEFCLDSREEALFSGIVIYEDGSYDEYDSSLARLQDLDKKITTPIKAEVGQALVVKSVDNNGAPITWDCADLQTFVTVAGDTASHTSAEIYTHVENGELVVLSDSVSYFNLYDCDEHGAVFSRINPYDNISTVIEIGEQGDAQIYEYKARPQTLTVTYDPLTGLADSNVHDIDTLITSGLSVMLYANNLYYNFIGIDDGLNYASFIHVTQDGRTLRCTVDQGKEVVFYDSILTDADKEEIKSYVDEAILGGAW